MVLRHDLQYLISNLGYDYKRSYQSYRLLITSCPISTYGRKSRFTKKYNFLANAAVLAYYRQVFTTVKQ